MVYLKNIEDDLSSNTSYRDLILYNFLKGIVYNQDFPPNDIETKLCHESLINNKGETELKKLRKAKPFKGFHYTTNLVLLIAAAKIDLDGEMENINNYLSESSYKEQFIVNQALGTKFNVAKKYNTNIEYLAKLLEDNSYIEEHHIKNSLISINDIYDLYIFNASLTSFLTKLREEKNIESYNKLVDINKISFKRIEYFIYIIALIFIAFVSFKLIPSFINIVVTKWDILEPFAYLLDKAIIIFLLVTGLVLTKLVKPIRTKIRHLILSVTFKLLGSNYQEYKELLRKVERQ